MVASSSDGSALSADAGSGPLQPRIEEIAKTVTEQVDA
jgi:hypothetical protein